MLIILGIYGEVLESYNHIIQKFSYEVYNKVNFWIDFFIIKSPGSKTLSGVI